MRAFQCYNVFLGLFHTAWQLMQGPALATLAQNMSWLPRKMQLCQTHSIKSKASNRHITAQEGSCVQRRQKTPRKALAEGPEFRLGNFAVNLKREISHATLKCHQIPPPPLYVQILIPTDGAAQSTANGRLCEDACEDA